MDILTIAGKPKILTGFCRTCKNGRIFKEEFEEPKKSRQEFQWKTREFTCSVCMTRYKAVKGEKWINR